MSVVPFPSRPNVAVDQNVSPEASGKSARIIPFRAAREIEAIEAVEIVRECIRAAFGPGSIEQIAKDAAKPLGTSAYSIRRIMDGSTVRFDGRVGFRAVAFGVGALPPGAVADLMSRYAQAVNINKRSAA